MIDDAPCFGLWGGLFCTIPGLADILETSRGAIGALSAPLRLTGRVQRRLVEFLVLVASRNMTQVDLAPVIR